MNKYKIFHLITEGKKPSRSIIMAGSAGSGKTTFLNQIKPDLKKNDWTILNVDKYVEDENSPMYKNLSAASQQIEKKDLPQALQNKRNYVYDTTASNVPRITNLKDNPDYETAMVMMYTHPIVSFLRNFSRERKVPTAGVLTSWNNVYKNIDEYKKLFGDKFYLVPTGVSEEEKKTIAEFNKAYKNNRLGEYFEELLGSGKYKSSFRKDPTQKKSPEEIAKYKALQDKQLDTLQKQFGNVEKQIQQLSSKDLNATISSLKSFING